MMKQQKGFMPFTLLGWPNLETSWVIIRSMIEAGVNALELGLPFSEPVADGPVIQQAVFESLQAGFTVDQGFELLRRARDFASEHSPGLLISLMVYHNMVLARGTQVFCADAARAGVDALLVVDLPVEILTDSALQPQDDIITACQQASAIRPIAPVFLVSPLTTAERLSQITQLANTVGSDYVYAVSRLGITGAEARYDTQLQSVLKHLKSLTDCPVYVGFGISSPEDARHIISLGADGVITGSKVLQLVRQALDAGASQSELAQQLSAYFKDMQQAVCL